MDANNKLSYLPPEVLVVELSMSSTILIFSDTEDYDNTDENPFGLSLMG